MEPLFDDSTNFDLNPQVGPVPKGFQPGPWAGERRPNPSWRIDINQPCILRYVGQTGQMVAMFHHKPGYFFNELGREVSVEMAQEAGFDVERMLKIRRRNEARDRAIAAVDAEFEIVGGRKVVEERGEYRLVEVAEGFFNVEFEDGFVLNAKGPVSREIAYKLLDANAPKPEASASQPAEAGDPKRKGK